MNDFSPNIQETLWWMNNSTPNFPNHVSSDEVDRREEKVEHMFEKPLTPSDVGKLNRLVIPKQYAEKYLPLSRMESAEKGVLLTFEDEHGKLWRFRYSYWNSSQSYVLTKGWSRFVKEKQLDAGDVVSFERRRPDGQQLYIRWRRRVLPPLVQDSRLQAASSTSAPWSGRLYYSAHPYPSHPFLYQPDCVHAVGLMSRVGNDSVQPVVEKKVASKKQVRLFGVNLDCQLDEPDEPPGPDVSNQGSTSFLYTQGGGWNPSIQQDFNFSREYHYPGNE